MIILDVEQGSDEWFAARVGVASASNFAKIITPTGKKSTQCKAYMNQVIAEKLMGHKIETHQSEAMTRGIEMEQEARDWYEFETGESAAEVGLVYLNDDKRVSCSPDGLLNDKGLEIKCPLPHTHIEYLLKGEIPGKYIPQVQGSMLVTGLKEWDFVSYHPELKPLLVTVQADEEYQAKLSEYLSSFIEEMDQAIAKIG